MPRNTRASSNRMKSKFARRRQMRRKRAKKDARQRPKRSKGSPVATQSHEDGH